MPRRAPASATNQRYWGEAVVSGPITDWLRFRLGGNITQENGGYFKNLDGPRQGGGLPQLSAGQSQYVEGQLDANLGDHLDAWGMISSGRFEGDYHQNATSGAIPNNYQLNGGFSPSNFFGLCGLPGVATSPGGATGCTGPGAAGQTVVPGSVGGGPVFANAFPGNNPTTTDRRDVHPGGDIHQQAAWRPGAGHQLDLSRARFRRDLSGRLPVVQLRPELHQLRRQRHHRLPAGRPGGGGRHCANSTRRQRAIAPPAAPSR